MVKKIGIALLIGIISTYVILLTCNKIITNAAENKTYWNVENVPKNRVGLVLGTSNKLVGGGSNPYYTNRIKATLELYRAGKIDFVLVSGDNGSLYYNEPNVFKKDLIKGGIPAENIFLDYAGFRTLDSMVRAKAIFGLDNVTVISQKFHNERAIYLAEKKGLHAIGFNADGISLHQGLKVQLREYFARVKVFIDLALNTQPKFLGEKIEIK
ncbi:MULTISPECIES: vancomycin high temperature exclusion protein [unclassified Arenibacter]|jgi:SanA protein|uniref:SanA/YdcF family protein n=1 Tax=unclassified Arenibacter TaxID=2615047 RepID=UPI000E34F31B|nr:MULTISPECIES: ElyC/SanA/YdcF family protein [unclassified Arenibacter]MCM4162732.1 protein SanA [Arenibacter sp. A80]RFT58295.1 vancomycin high temperature exclusion protein [Arenibacter sp. P308M17]